MQLTDTRKLLAFDSPCPVTTCGLWYLIDAAAAHSQLPIQYDVVRAEFLRYG
jgi:hypothetical protein